MSKKRKPSMITQPFICGGCDHRFGGIKGAREHIRAKHPEGASIFKAEIVEKVDGRPKGTPSIADMMIDAQLSAAMGDYVDNDWLLDMA